MRYSPTSRPVELPQCGLCGAEATATVNYPVVGNEAHLCTTCAETLHLGLRELQYRHDLGKKLGGHKKIGVPKGANEGLVTLLVGLARYQVRVRIETVARRFGILGPVEKQLFEGHLRVDIHAGTKWSAYSYGVLALYATPATREPLVLLDEYILVGARRVWCVDQLLALAEPKLLWTAHG